MKLFSKMLGFVLIASLAFLTSIPNLFAADVNLTTLTRTINAQYTNASRTALKLSENDYTVVTWGAYETAVLAGQDGEYSETITQEEVDALVTAINNSKTALEFAGLADLNTAIANANAKEEADYTASSWTSFDTAKTAAAALEQTTNALILTKTDAYNDAMDLLVFAGLADLNTAKASATGKVQANYSTASWTALTNALALPETNNDEIVAKTTAINNAVSGLKFAGQDALDAIVIVANAKAQADYTVDSWTLFDAAKSAAAALPETNNDEIVTKTSAYNNALTKLVFAGLADLNTAKTSATGKVQANYTLASWTALTDALALPEGTNAEVVAKTTAINDAVSGLVFAGLADLNTAKNTANGKVENDYTADSWTTFTNARTIALALPEGTNAEIIAKTTALNNAMTSLVFAGLTDLNTAKNSVTGKTSTDYTTASWKTLTDALALPEGTNAEIVTKTTAINDAISGLVFSGLADLTTTRNTANAKVESDYTADSWTAFTDARTIALALSEGTNAEIIAKTTALNNAMNLLVFANKDNLDAAKSSAATKIETDYTIESWTTLTDALALPEGTNAELGAKIAAINNAISGLVINTNTTALTQKINAQYTDKARRQVLGLLASDYTAESWAIYNAALVNAKTIEFDLNSLQSVVNNAIAAIDNALNNLVFAGLADLNTAKADAATKVAADYTAGTYLELTNALAMSETTNAQIVAKTLAIGQAIDGLRFAGQTALDNAKTAVTAKVESDYTTASWATFTSDINTANALPETTNAEVVAKTTALNNAMAKLVFAGKAALDAAKATAATKVKSYYTLTSWNVLVSALALPETTNAQIVTKTTAINNAISKLVLNSTKIVLGQTITIKAGTHYWSDSWAAKAGIGGRVLTKDLTTKVTKIAYNGCFNVTYYLGWFNPALLIR